MNETTENTTGDLFFIGAGFDAEYLQPVMRDFPDDLESLYMSSPGFLQNHQFLRLIERRSIQEDNNLKKDLDIYYQYVKKLDFKVQCDIEELIDFAHTKLPKDSNKIFFNLFHYVLFLRELRFYREEKESPLLYEKLLKKNCTIITTNYTAFIEKEHPNKETVKEGEVYHINTTEPSFFGVFKELKKPCVLKLHGGVMFYCENKNLMYVFTNENKQFIPYNEFRKERGILGEHVHPEAKYSQLIVPPFKNKDEFINATQDKFLFYKNIWNHAEDELKTASRVFIIGYSFNNDDEKVEQLLKSFIKDGTSVYIVSSGNFNKEKICSLFKKPKHIKMRAADFVGKYAQTENYLEGSKQIECDTK